MTQKLINQSHVLSHVNLHDANMSIACDIRKRFFLKKISQL